MDGATPLNTPPATDRGLSEEDVALVVATFGHCPKEGESLLINRFGLSALLAAARREGEGEGGIASRDHASDTGIALVWRPIESAPKDGTPILAWCVHPHARHATDDKEWSAAVVTQWIDFNGGGWTWHGLAGRFTHWMPLPAAPSSAKQVLASDPGSTNQ